MADILKRYKYVTVVVDPETPTWVGKPMYAVVNNRSSTRIAELVWYAPWKRYIARFDPDTVWSEDCLADIRDAMALAENEALVVGGER